MFGRVGLRLAILNAIVISLILTLISSVLFLLTREQIYSKVDHSLQISAIPFVLGRGPGQQGHFFKRNFFHGLPFPNNSPHLGELPTVFILWNHQFQYMLERPSNTFTQQELLSFKSSLLQTNAFTKVVDGHVFRVLNVDISGNVLPFLPQGGELQLLRNMDEQVKFLRDFLWFIAAGILVGFVIAIGAGLFLARQALIPIRRSWDQQQRFVSDASHELRTPLAVVQTYTQLLLRHPEDTIEQHASQVYSIEKEARRMSKIAQDLLTLARADSNQMELVKELVSISEMIDEIKELYEILCLEKNLQVIFDIEKDVTLLGDPERLKQLLWIILDNAMKYTPSGGVIKIFCKKIDSLVEITISDTGIGIAKSDIQRIFDRFYRGDKARSPETGGVGLGLAIAKWIVDTHHGKIAVHSEPGQGTSFKITFATAHSLHSFKRDLP